jgi:hypothetical protein
VPTRSGRGREIDRDQFGPVGRWGAEDDNGEGVGPDMLGIPGVFELGSRAGALGNRTGSRKGRSE